MYTWGQRPQWPKDLGGGGILRTRKKKRRPTPKKGDSKNARELIGWDPRPIHPPTSKAKPAQDQKRKLNQSLKMGPNQNQRRMRNRDKKFCYAELKEAANMA